MSDILVVDDSEFDLAIVKKVFRVLGDWNTVYVSNGEQAIACLDERHFDVVLTDLQMPQMNGLELLKTIKAQGIEIPVVVMSAKGSEESAIEALRLGAANYVIKKKMIHDLPGIIESVMRSSRSTQLQSQLLQHLQDTDFRFVIPNDRGLIHAAITFIQDAAERFGKLNPPDRIRLGIGLEETLLNAMIHGNLEVSSELREQEYDAYERLIAMRLKQAPYRDRTIEIAVHFTSDQLTFQITDQGPGFDITQVADPTDAENLSRPSGRGLLLLRMFMDDVHHNSLGNQITFTKKRFVPVLVDQLLEVPVEA